MPALAAELECSSWHVLFPDAQRRGSAGRAGLHTRHQVQFHWFNRGYRDFDDFPRALRQPQAQGLRRERRRVAEQGIELRMRDGTQLSEADWAAFHRFYQMTYAKRSGHGGYLTREFFLEVAPRLGAGAHGHRGQERRSAVAGALYFRDETRSTALLGLHPRVRLPALRGLLLPGHRLLHPRGPDSASTPGPRASTRSSAASSRPPPCPATGSPAGTQCAVGDFTRREKDQVERYREEACTLLPFKAGQWLISPVAALPAQQAVVGGHGDVFEEPVAGGAASSSPTRSRGCRWRGSRSFSHWSKRALDSEV
jgi:hypothetical protein